MRYIALALFASTLLSGFKTGYFGKVDIRYDFESTDIASGPDTFELFEYSSSDVSLSSSYAFRGARSLHIQDLKKNQSFPEFQGYFPEVSGGTVQIGFALMTPDPAEPFNVAVAGKNHFSMTQNGMGFWLINDSGTLRHMSNSIPKRLLTLSAYEWYWFEIELDVSNGFYSLKISNESGRELLNLEQQKHPSNRAKSSILKYSFTGDLKDKGNTNLYIDEFVLRTEYADSPKPLIAPGRRSLFVDQWNEYHKTQDQLDYCLPPSLPYDFIDIYNTKGLQVLQQNTKTLRALLDQPSSELLDQFSSDHDLLNGIAKWAKGCHLLKLDKPQQAMSVLEEARFLIGNTKATTQSLALAYAKSGQYYAAQSSIYTGQAQWPDDARWLILSAAVGFISDDIRSSETVLERASSELKSNIKRARRLADQMGWLSNSAIRTLKREQVRNKHGESFIIAEQYYFSLLWQGQYSSASDYATKFNSLLRRYGLDSPLWIERIADAALFDNRLDRAEKAYKSVLELDNERMSSLQKLSDVYFLQGRSDDEKKLRESIFGILDYQN